jgi:type II secretory pathway pseudopilin PulG
MNHPPRSPGRQRGAIAIVAAVFIIAVLASAAAIAMSAHATEAQRQRITTRALALAKEALIAYAAERPITAVVGPGYLPCPDTDDDGWAESTCGSLSGHLGQADRLGRLPWKTLGLADLRDGHGERLWYAVSSKHKGLLNCAASHECRDLTPASALGTITVRDARGTVIHDGTSADVARAADGGAVAVVIAPGPALVRIDGRAQRRDCAAGDCADPANYLDLAPGEDNAAFHDRNDAAARAGNGDGFIQGPIAATNGTVMVNDRLAVVGYADLMPRVQARVALEAANCLRRAAVLPRPLAACAASEHLGRIEGEFDDAACNLAGHEPAWWTAWKPFVLYAVAPAGGLDVVDEGGRKLAAARRFAVIAGSAADDCTAGRAQCGPAGCTQVSKVARGRDRHDAVASMP